jgi:hypothetical protein
MGAQTSNFLPQAQEQFVWVHRPSGCNEAGGDFNPSEPMLPHIESLISHREWTSLLNNINPHVDSFQKYLWVQKMTAAVCVPLAIIRYSLPTSNEASPIINIAFILAILLSIWKQRTINQANQKVDRQIEQVDR